MKQIASIFLSLLFLYNSMGYYVLFALQEETIKTEMRNLPDNEFTETLRISKSDLSSVVFQDEGSEIIYKGNLYDVKNVIQEKDAVIFHCLNDKKETELFAKLDDHIQNNMDAKSPSGEKQNNISKNILKDYFFSGKYAIFISSRKYIFPSAFCLLPSAFSPSLSSPPPKQA